MMDSAEIIKTVLTKGLRKRCLNLVYLNCEDPLYNDIVVKYHRYSNSEPSIGEMENILKVVNEVLFDLNLKSDYYFLQKFTKDRIDIYFKFSELKNKKGIAI